MNKFRTVLILILTLFLGSELIAQDAGLLRASFLLNNQNFSSAFDEVRTVSPSINDADYYYELLGESAAHLEKTDQAIEAWKKRTKYPGPGIAYFELAKLYFQLDDQESGYQYLTKHLESLEKLPYNSIISDPAFENLDKNRDWIRFWSNDWYSQLEDQIAEVRSLMSSEFLDEEPMEKLMQLYGEHLDVQLLAAQYYCAMNMKHRWQNIIDELAGPDCTDAKILNIAGELYNKVNDYSTAVKYFERSINVIPYQTNVWMTLIDLYDQTGDQQSSLATLEKLNAYGVENSKLQLLQARKQMNKNPEASIGLVNRVLNVNPLDEIALNLRSELLLKSGDTYNALYDLTQSLDIKPDQPDVYFMRAQIRLKIGDDEGACHDWKKALRYGHRKALDKLYKHCGY